MKAIRFVTLMALGLALSLFATGCHPENLKTIHGAHNDAPEVPPMPPLQPPTLPPDNDAQGKNVAYTNDFPSHTNWIENVEQLKADTIHFAFDSSVVKSGDKSKIADVANFLKNNPDAAVRVEGNCDERGTEEYNRSLGERRALAAREELVALGIASGRVDTISYGEDKPVDSGHGASAWTANRRDDFVVLTPPGK